MSAKQPKIGIAKIYLKDLSFESPASPMIFSRPWQPRFNLNVSVTHSSIQESMYEVVLKLNVEANADEKVICIVEIEQAGLFEIQDVTEEQLQHVLKVFCPTTLFPYARQVLDTSLNQGGFPSLMLSPVNFEAMLHSAPAQTETQN